MMKRLESHSTLSVGAVLALLLFSTVCISQTISLIPNTGPPTTTTRVSGTGFVPNTKVVISFDKTRLAFATADASGAFSNVPVPVPSSAAPGRHTVTAAAGSGVRGSSSFLVRTNWSQFHFDPAQTGFNPYENVLSRSSIARLKPNWKFMTKQYGWNSASAAWERGLMLSPRRQTNIVWEFSGLECCHR
jgi:hypothetical protein